MSINNIVFFIKNEIFCVRSFKNMKLKLKMSFSDIFLQIFAQLPSYVPVRLT